MKRVLMLLALLGCAATADAQLLWQPQIVPVLQPVQSQPMEWRAFWVPQTGILGRTTWTVRWVAVPVQTQSARQQL